MIAITYTRHGRRFDHLQFRYASIAKRWLQTLMGMGATDIKVRMQ